MVSNKSPNQLGELTGILSIDSNGNYNTPAESKSIKCGFSYFRSPQNVESCAKHEENEELIPGSSNKTIPHFSPSSLWNLAPLHWKVSKQNKHNSVSQILVQGRRKHHEGANFHHTASYKTTFYSICLHRFILHLSLSTQATNKAIREISCRIRCAISCPAFLHVPLCVCVYSRTVGDGLGGGDPTKGVCAGGSEWKQVFIHTI